MYSFILDSNLFQTVWDKIVGRGCW